MQNQFSIDATWFSRVYEIADMRVSAYVKHFSDFNVAEAFLEAHHSAVYHSGGALFRGQSAAITTITVDQIQKLLNEGMEIPDPEPGWIEIVFIPQISFPDTLFLLEVFEFKANSEDESEARRRRKEVRDLLSWVNGICPIGMFSLNRFGVSFAFLEAKSHTTAGLIFKKTFQFNQKYYDCELSEETWKDSFEATNVFSIGPC